MAGRHPELHRQVRWSDFEAICAREKIIVRIVALSRPARLVRFGQHVCIQINRAVHSSMLRTRYGMHELSHFWRDDPGEACYHAEEEWVASESEDFADLFAWQTTSPAGKFARDRRAQITLWEYE
jgi:hypothetical protein